MRRLAASLLLLAACNAGPAPTPAPSASARAPAPDRAAAARRPARRWFVGRTASRCEVYRVDEEGIGKGREVPCPQDLEIGERIRLAGKTCLRESSVRDRVEPVVCPGPLIDEDLADQARDGG
jgi:hypothetical protein